MKKIIITGHPQSGYQQIEALLLSSGMAAALPSQRNQLTAQQITATLLKAHGVPTFSQIEDDQALMQIDVAPVWQGMVLDLMLANLDHSLWGWADSHVIQLLEYWKAQDPQIAFVLVYDAPQTALTRLSLEDAAASIKELQQRLKVWVAYNSTLLQFYLRNTQRCVLVHASQVEPSAQHYVQLINSRIGAPLHLCTPAMAKPPLRDATTNADIGTGDTDTPPWSAHSIVVLKESPQDLAHSQQAHMLLAQLLDTYPQAQTLYEELQAVATLPRSNQQALTWSGDTQSRFIAWQEFIQLHQCSRTAQADLLKKQEQFVQMQKVLESDLEKTNALLIAETASKNQLQTQLQKSNKQQEEVVEENDLLLTQLRQVQEELEQHYLDSQRLKEECEAKANQLLIAQSDLQKVQENLKAAQAKANKLPTIQKELKKTQETLRVVQTQKNANVSKNLEEENKLLLLQLNQVQEELEGYYLENKKLKESGPSCKQISVQNTYYGAADRIKRQISYRLGSVMIEKSRTLSGWLTMPFALRAEVKRFHQESAVSKEESLPAIECYHDADEAEKIKRHLSYRLGSTFMQRSNTLSGWLGMPWALRAQVKEFQQSRHQISRAGKF